MNDNFIEAGDKLLKKAQKINDTMAIGYTKTDRINDLIPHCIELIKAAGYKVVNPVHSNEYVSIDKLDKLVEYFYQRYDFLYPEKNVPVRNNKRDRAIMSRMIKARQEANGLNKKIAMMECAEIIDTVLSNPNKFKLLFKIGIRVFGQDEMSWVTDEAVGMLNDKKSYELSDELLEKIEEANKTYDGPHGIMHLIEEKEKLDGKEKSRS